MSGIFLAVMLVAVLGSCGARNSSAPRNLDNACTILMDRADFVRAFRDADRKWGTEPHVLMAMIYQESKFVGQARTPFRYTLGVIPMGRQRSAFGYSQALVGTWGAANCGAPAVVAVGRNTVVLNALATVTGSLQYNTVDTTTYLLLSAEL